MARQRASRGAAATRAATDATFVCWLLLWSGAAPLIAGHAAASGGRPSTAPGQLNEGPFCDAIRSPSPAPPDDPRDTADKHMQARAPGHGASTRAHAAHRDARHARSARPGRARGGHGPGRTRPLGRRQRGRPQPDPARPRRSAFRRPLRSVRRLWLQVAIHHALTFALTPASRPSVPAQTRARARRSPRPTHRRASTRRKKPPRACCAPCSAPTGTSPPPRSTALCRSGAWTRCWTRCKSGTST
jgi:hypothetical protein